MNERISKAPQMDTVLILAPFLQQVGSPQHGGGLHSPSSHLHASLTVAQQSTGESCTDSWGSHVRSNDVSFVVIACKAIPCW